MGTEAMYPTRLKRLLPWGLTAIVLLLTLLLVILLIADEQTKAAAGFNSESAWGTVVLGVIPVFFAVLGAIIATHQPGNPISWLFIAVGFAFLFEGLGWMVVVDHPEPPSFGDVLALAMVNSGFFIFSVAAFLVLYIFPTGRFLNRRWSWAGWLAAAVSAEVFFVHLFLEEVGLADFPGQDWVTHNPFGVIPVDLWYDGPLQVVFGIGLITLFVGVIPAVIVRYLRSSGLVRAQIKWVGFAAGVWVVVFAINLFSPGEGDVFSTLNFIALAMIPVSVVVAITRFRLYDIDRIISRTIGYTVVVVSIRRRVHARGGLVSDSIAGPSAAGLRRSFHPDRGRSVQQGAQTDPRLDRPPLLSLPLQRRAGHRFIRQTARERDRPRPANRAIAHCGLRDLAAGDDRGLGPRRT